MRCCTGSCQGRGVHCQRSRSRLDEHREKGGSHAYPTHATVQPTKVPGCDDARGDRRACLAARQAGSRGAAPETTTIRWLRSPAICVAPYYVAEELLHGEGFTEVRHVQTSVQLWTQAVLSGEVDIVLNLSDRSWSG